MTPERPGREERLHLLRAAYGLTVRSEQQRADRPTVPKSSKEGKFEEQSTVCVGISARARTDQQCRARWDVSWLYCGPNRRMLRLASAPLLQRRACVACVLHLLLRVHRFCTSCTSASSGPRPGLQWSDNVDDVRFIHGSAWELLHLNLP